MTKAVMRVEYSFFILLFFISSSNEVKITSTPATCGSKNLPYSLSPGEVRMFQSPSYPKSISTGTTNNTIPCSASFTRADNTGNLLIYLVNGNMGNFVFQNAVEIDYFNNFESNGYTTYNSIKMRNRIFYGENNPNIAFHFGPQSDIVDWTAFQGLVYAPSNPKLVSNCLLSGESFNLTDSTQIIPIFAYGNLSTQEAELCTWSFNIPSGYKLKVVITSLNLYTLETLNVAGAINNAIKDIGSYVVEGQQVQVIYNKHHVYYSFYPQFYGFEGYVTLVKSQNPVKKSCQHVSNNNHVIYSNFDKDHGYSNNMICEQPLIADFKKIYSIVFTKGYYEWYSDIIQVKDSKNTVYPLDFGTVYYYEPSSTEKSDYLNFTSDDSVFQGGFELLQTPKDCTCYNKPLVAPCNTETNSGFTGDGSDYGYCSNANCNISIVVSPDCPNKMIFVNLSILFRENGKDSLTIYGGQIPVTYLSNLSTPISASYGFLPHTPVTVRLHTGPSPSTIYKSPTVYMTLKTFAPPKMTKITLPEGDPVFGLDLSKNGIGYYNVSVPKGYKLDVSMAFNENIDAGYNYFDLYDGTQYVGTLSALHYPDSTRKYIPRRYQSQSGYLIVGSPTNQTANVILFFRNIISHAMECPDENNIFQLNGAYPTGETNFIAKGGNNGNCMYTILNYPSKSLHITKLEPNMSSKILFVAGADKRSPLFSFDQNSASEWNAVNLKGMFNSFVISINNTLTVGIIDSEYDRSNSDSGISFFHGVVYSESYGYPYAPSHPNGITLPTITFPKMSKIQFTCKFLDLRDGEEVTVSGNKVTSIGQIITINNNTADIAYVSTIVGKRGFLLEFTSAAEYFGNPIRIGLSLILSFLFLFFSK